MKRLIRKIAAALAPLTVCADWAGGMALHKAWTRAGALDWMRCYPSDARVVVRDRYFRVIGSRI
jgi:hypothetical protein